MERFVYSLRRLVRTAIQAALVLSLLLGSFPVPVAQAVNSVPKILNYQARITDSGGVPVPNGTLSVIFKLYDGDGTCLYSAQGSCGTPTAKTVTVTNGVFTTAIGAAADGDNEIPDGLFDNNVVTLGITVGADAEMTPRKRLTAAAYAFNADRLDDLDVTSSGSTTPYIPSTTTNGNLVITGDPQGSGVGNGSFYVNPANAAANETLLGIASNGSTRFQIDNEGDIAHTGSLLATSASSTAQFLFRGAASQSVNIFEVQDVFTSSVVGISATGTLIGVQAAGYRVGIGNAAPANTFTVGTATSTFEVNSAGDLVKVNNVPYSWPASQGSASTVLQNNGSGSLSWAAASGLVNLNQAYLSSTSTGAYPEISITPSLGAVTISDTFSGTGNIFEIQDRTTSAGDYSQRYFTVSSTATFVYSKNNVSSLVVGASTDNGSSLVIRGANAYVASESNQALVLASPGASGATYFQVGGTNRFLINGSGNASFGHASPNARFSISQNAATANIFEINDANTAGVYSNRYFTVSSTSTQVIGGSRLIVGATNTLVVNSSGNFEVINGVTTRFPSSQGSSSQVLTNDGAGNLTWTTPTASTTLQQAYDNDANGSDVTITTNTTDGDVIIAGDQDFRVTSTGLIVFGNNTHTTTNAVTLNGTALTTGNLLTLNGGQMNMSTGVGAVMSATGTAVAGFGFDRGLINLQANMASSVGTFSTFIGGMNIDFNDVMRAGNTHGVAGYNLNITSNGFNAHTQYGYSAKLLANSASPSDSTWEALYFADTADTASGNLIAVTNGMLITNSGNASGGMVNGVTIGASAQPITTALNIASTGVTTDIRLQNGEVIHNDTDGTISFTDGTNTLCTIVDGGTTGSLSCTGGITASTSLQAAYGNATSTTELTISGRNALTIADTLGGRENIFEIQDLTSASGGSYSRRYFTVSSTTTAVTSGTASMPGLSFIGDADTGIYQNLSGAVAFTSNGSTILIVEPTGDVTQFGGGGFYNNGGIIDFGASTGSLADTPTTLTMGAAATSLTIGATTGTTTIRTALTVNRRLDTLAHTANVGLNIPTNAGTPSSVTGTAEGDIVWDTSGDQLYVYNGSAFQAFASNLNQAYLSSTSTGTYPEISITPSLGALTIGDTFSGTGNIFEIQDRTNSTGDYSRRYLTVSATSTIIRSRSTVSTLEIGATNDNGSNLTIHGDNAFVTSDSNKAFVFASPGASGNMYFQVGGVNRLFITGTGNASFGHTIPNARFNISQRAATANIFEVNDANTSGVYINRYFTVSSTSTQVIGGGQLIVGATNTLVVNSSGNFEVVNGVTTRFPSSQGSNGQVLTNDGAGNLTWTSVSAGSTNLNQAYLSSTSTGAYPEISITPSLGALTLADTLSGTGNIFEIQNRTTSAGDYSQRYLTVSATSVALFTNAPQSTFHINHLDPFAGYPFTVQTNGSDIFVMDYQGNTTIGRSLSVSRSIELATDADQFWPFPALYVHPAADFVSDLLQLNVGSTNRMMVSSAGYLGLNDSTPDSLLTVRGPASPTEILFEISNASNSARYMAVSSTSTSIANSVTIGSTSSTDTVSFNARVGSNFTPTTDATYSLGDYNRRWKDLWLSGGSAYVAYDTSGTSVMKIGTETATGYRGVIATPDNMPLHLKTTRAAGDTNGIYISTTGGVGMGTTNPTGRLGIVSTDSPSVVIAATNTSLTGGTLMKLMGGGANMTSAGTVLTVDMGAATTGSGISLVNTGAFASAGTGILTVTANSLTTGNGILLQENALTNGRGLFITTTSNNISSSTLLDLASSATALAGSETSHLFRGTFSPTVSTAISPTLSGDMLSLIRTITTSHASANASVNGPIAYFEDNGTQSSGTLTSTANVVTIVQNYAANKGSGLSITTSSGAAAGGINVGSAAFTVSGTGTVQVAGDLSLLTSGGKLKFPNAAGNTYSIYVPTNSAGQGTCTSGSDEGIIFRNTGGTRIGRLACVANATNQLRMFAQAFTTASTDLAEMYSTRPEDGVAVGDVVSFDRATGNLFVKKSTGAYSSDVAGVISDSPGIAMTGISDATGIGDTSNGQFVAFKGRVPVKVSDENGAIEVGDYLTTSSVAGVAMKATKPGMVIGRALDAWSGTGQGTIRLFVEVGYHSGMAITTDGMKSLFADDFAFKPLDVSSASGTSFSSYALNFGASAWDSASNTALTRNISIKNDITSIDEYQLAFRNNSDQLLASLNQAGDLALAGSLTVNGGFDYAETFPATPDLDAGDIVMVDAENANGYGVKKSDAAYENTLLGVISTKPGFLTGKTSPGTQPVALAGRVPVKVNTESGEIKPGDPITSSSTPGVGMKAAEAGRVIGIALQGWNEDGVGMITVFVNPSWWNGPASLAGTTAGGTLSLTQDSLIDFKNSTLSNVAAIVSTNGLWSISADGYLIAERVEAKEVNTNKLTLKANAAADRVVGKAKLQPGYDAILVENPHVTEESIIVITFEANPGSNWWIAEKHQGSFMLKLAQGAIGETPFTYWVLPIDGILDPSTVTDEGAQSDEPTESGTGTPLLGNTDPTVSGSGTPVVPPATGSGTTTSETP